MHVISHAGVATAWHGAVTGAVGSHGAAWRDADGARRARRRIRVRPSPPLRVAPTSSPPVAPRAGPGRAAFPRLTGSSSWARGTPAGSRGRAAAAFDPLARCWTRTGELRAPLAPRAARTRPRPTRNQSQMKMLR